MRITLLLFLFLLSTAVYTQINDCSGADVICGDDDISFNPNGAGFNDFANPNNIPGCITSLESNSAWYYFEIDENAPPGLQIGFTISPNGGYGEDYDWAVFGPDVNCDDLGSPIRCSSASSMCDFCPETGMGMGAMDTSEGPGFGDGFTSMIDVSPGQGFFLLIDNWLGTNNGFMMSWTGSAAPYLDCSAEPPCGLTSIAGNDITACENAPPFPLNGDSSGGNGSETYSWTGTNGGTGYLNNPNIQSPTVTLPPGFSGTITYTLIVSEDACIDEDEMVLTVTPLPAVSLSPAGPLCQESSPLPLNANPPGGTWTGAPNGTFDPQLNGPGTHTVTYTVTQNNCTNSASIDIIVNSNPSVSINPDPAEFCTNDGGILLTATGTGGQPGYQYEWSSPIGNGTGSEFFAPGAGSFVVLITDVNGCTATDVVDVTENMNPLVVTVDPGPICQSLNSYTLTGVPNGGVWTGPIVTPEGEIFPSGIGSGTYTVTYTYTDNNGCSSSEDLEVTIIPPPLALPFNNGPYCEGETIELFGSTDGMGSIITYSWTGPNGYTSSLQNPTDASAPGPYLLEVTVDGCASELAITMVDVTPMPDAMAFNDGPYCPGQDIQLNGFTSTSGNIIDYEWTGPNGYSSNVQNPFDATESGLYELIITVDGCESETVNTLVEFNNAPDALAVNSGPYCPGESINLFAETNTSGNVITYSWTGPNAYTSSEENPVDATAAGIYNLVIDVDGCISNPVQTEVIITDPPEPLITGDDEFCAGISGTLDAGAYDQYLWSDGSTNQTLDINQQGTYGVTVTDGNGCTGIDEILVIVNPNPDPTISGSTSFCAGSTTTLDAGANYNSYLWSDGSVNQTLTVSTSGDYSVTVSDANSCTGEALVTVIESSSLNPSISGDNEYCEGSSSLLDAGTGFDSYLWNDGSVNQTLTVNTPGDYSVTVSDGVGCTGEASISISENQNPIPNISGADSFCNGSSTTIDAGNGYDEYLWSDGSVDQTLLVNTTGLYSIIVTDSNGCTGEDNINITENQAIEPIITGILELCEGESSTLDAGSGFSTYLWSSGEDTQTINVNTSADYTVTVSDTQGCTGETTASLVVHQNPVAQIIGEDEFCSGETVTLDAGAGFQTYNWSNGEVTQTIDVTDGNTYSVVVSNAFSCTDEASFTLTENPNPVPAITGANSFCTGTSTTIDAGNGYIEYLWSDGSVDQTLLVNTPGLYSVIVTDGNGCTGEASIDISESQALEPVISGDLELCDGENAVLDAGSGYSTYLWSSGEDTQTINVNTSADYTVTVSDTQGCTGETTASLVVHQNPDAQIIGEDEFCSGETVTLDAGAGFDTYNWSNGEVTQTIDVTDGNTYSVVVSNAFACTDEASFTLTENPVPVPVITGPLSFCTGNSVLLDAGAGYTEYLWSNSETTQTVDISSSTTISVVVTDANACTGTDQVSITENASLNPQITGMLSFCEGENTLLDAGNGFETYEWSNGELTQTITIDDGGSYTVIVTDSDGCSGSDNVGVTEFQNPDPIIDGSSTFCSGGFSTLSAGNYDSYLWSDGSITQSIIVNTAGTYSVDVIDINGCAGQASIVVSESTSLNPIISGGLSFCENESTTLNAGSGFDTYLWSNGSMDQTYEVTIPGDYSVTVSDGQGCTGETTVSVSEILPPSAVLQNDTSICNTQAGGSVLNLYDLVLSGDLNGTWVDADNSGAVGVFNNLNFNNIPSGDYNFIYTTNSAIAPCSEISYPITVTVIDCSCPDVQFLDADPLCNENELLDLNTIENTSEDGIWTIVQSPAGANPATITNSVFDATGSDEGTYTLQFELINMPPPGCPQTYSNTLTVDPTVSAGSTALLPAFCEEENEMVDLNSLLVGADLNGSWSETSASPSQGAAFDPMNGTFNTAGQSAENYTFLYSVTSNGACPDDETSLSITINPLPTALAGVSVNLDCMNPTNSLNAAGSSTGANFETEWTGPGLINDGNENSLTPTIGAAGLYELTITNTSTGCVATDDVQVTDDFDNPQVAAGPDQTLDCNVTFLNLNASGDINAPFQIQWEGPDIDAGNENSPAPTIELPGSYILNIFNPVNGCSSADTVIVLQDNIPPVIVIQSALEEIDCDNPTAQLLADSPTSNISFEWFDPESNTIGNSPVVDNITQAGTYTIVLTNTINGCTASETIIVEDNTEYPIAEAGTPDLITCTDSVATLNGTGSETGTDISYQWTGPGISGADDQIMTSAELPGVYTLTVVNTSNGCTASDQVNINQDIQAPTIFINPTEMLDCTIESVSIDGTGSSTGSNFNYLWTDASGNIVANSISTEVQQAGVYTLLITNTENGCEIAESIQVNQNTNLPTSIFYETYDPDCFGDTNGYLEINEVTGGTAPYIYSVNGSDLSTDPIFGNLAPGNYTLTIQDANGCELETNITINSVPELTLDLGLDLDLVLGESANIQAIVNTPDPLIDTIIWSPADIINCVDPECHEIELSTLNTIQVFATAIDINGCTADDEVTINLRKSRNVFIPNVFSPNDDGINDHFTIFTNDAQIENIPTFRIYDRWGALIYEAFNFEANDFSNGWDGTFEGQALNPGVFIYVAEIEFIDGNVQLYKGDVTLVK